MNKMEMMSIINASNDAETILNEKRESQLNLAREAREKLIQEMNDFVKEFFPLEIWEVLKKLPNIGTISYAEEKYADDLRYKIATENGIFIGFENTSDYWKLYFLQEKGKEILIRISNPHSYSFKGYDPKWVSGHTWWKMIEWCSSISNTEKDINSVREFTKMVDEIKSSIGYIYEEIAKANTKRLSAKANSIATNDINLGTETKKRVITITIEEV